MDEREPVPVHYVGTGGEPTEERVSVRYGNGGDPAEAPAPFTHMPSPESSAHAMPPKAEPSTADECVPVHYGGGAGVAVHYGGGGGEDVWEPATAAAAGGAAAAAAASAAAGGGAALGYGQEAATGAAVDGGAEVSGAGEAPFTAAGREAAAAAAGGPDCLSG